MKMQNVLNLLCHIKFILYVIKAVVTDSRCTTTTNSFPTLRLCIVQSPSCYAKCRDVDVNKLQELPSGGGTFSKMQATRAAARCIYCRRAQVHPYAQRIKRRKKRKIEKDPPERLMSPSSPRVSSFLSSSFFSRVLFFLRLCSDTIHAYTIRAQSAQKYFFAHQTFKMPLE